MTAREKSKSIASAATDDDARSSRTWQRAATKADIDQNLLQCYMDARQAFHDCPLISWQQMTSGKEPMNSER